MILCHKFALHIYARRKQDALIFICFYTNMVTPVWYIFKQKSKSSDIISVSFCSFVLF